MTPITLCIIWRFWNSGNGVTLPTKVVKRNKQALIDANVSLISSKGNLNIWWEQALELARMTVARLIQIFVLQRDAEKIGFCWIILYGNRSIQNKISDTLRKYRTLVIWSGRFSKTKQKCCRLQTKPCNW